MEFLQFIFMTGNLPYSIVFFDPNESHNHPSRHITICLNQHRLNNTILSYAQTQVQITVCICCENKGEVLRELQGYGNIASIMLCTTHHQTPHGIPNYPITIQENVFSDDERWQLDAHACALRVDQRRNIFLYIQEIIQHYLEEMAFPTHGGAVNTNPG